MGQYFIIVNITKGEYVHPQDLNSGMKMLEMERIALSILGLLSNGNGRGGGDLPDDPIWGHWAGDKIVIAGDYGDVGKWIEEVAKVLGTEPDLTMTLHEYIQEYGTNISSKIPSD